MNSMRLTSTVYGTRKDKGWSKAISSYLTEKPTYVLYWKLYVRRVLMIDHGDSNTSSAISRINQPSRPNIHAIYYIFYSNEARKPTQQGSMEDRPTTTRNHPNATTPNKRHPSNPRSTKCPLETQFHIP
jgi:hypothetical protein